VTARTEELERSLSGRIVLLGIGSRWRGDDAAGPEVLARVAGRVRATCIEAGDAPERHLGEATRGRPDAIVLVDAVDFGGAPGEVAVFRAGDLPPRAGTTHQTALGVLMRYLREESGAEVLLIGVQPASVGFGEPMSEAVREGVARVAQLLTARLPLRDSLGDEDEASPGPQGPWPDGRGEDEGEGLLWT
jgi:hydrogenase 3 maturation protease